MKDKQTQQRRNEKQAKNYETPEKLWNNHQTLPQRDSHLGRRVRRGIGACASALHADRTSKVLDRQCQETHKQTQKGGGTFNARKEVRVKSHNLSPYQTVGSNFEQPTAIVDEQMIPVACHRTIVYHRLRLRRVRPVP